MWHARYSKVTCPDRARDSSSPRHELFLGAGHPRFGLGHNWNHLWLFFVSQPVSNLLANYIGRTFKIYPKQGRSKPRSGLSWTAVTWHLLPLGLFNDCSRCSEKIISSPLPNPTKTPLPLRIKASLSKGFRASIAASLLHTPASHHPRIFCVSSSLILLWTHWLLLGSQHTPDTYLPCRRSNCCPCLVGPNITPAPRPLPPFPSSLYSDIISVRSSLATLSKVANVPQYFLSFYVFLLIEFLILKIERGLFNKCG